MIDDILLIQAGSDQIFSSVPGTYSGAVRDMAYIVTERLNGFPPSVAGLGWEAGVCMVLVDMIDQKMLATYKLLLEDEITYETAKAVAWRLIELCKANPREQKPVVEKSVAPTATPEDTVDELYSLLVDLAEHTPCRLDSHGYCQEHGWLAPGRCPHARAQEMLRERKV